MISTARNILRWPGKLSPGPRAASRTRTQPPTVPVAVPSRRNTVPAHRARRTTDDHSRPIQTGLRPAKRRTPAPLGLGIGLPEPARAGPDGCDGLAPHGCRRDFETSEFERENWGPGEYRGGWAARGCFMKLTNKQGLPQPLVEAVRNDSYGRGDADISVTQLLAPPRKVALIHEHAD